MTQPEWHDFGPLVSVASLTSGDTSTAIRLAFQTTAVLIEAVAADDTIQLQWPSPNIAGQAAPRAVDHEQPWASVIGTSFIWGRQMTNHHGFADGYQLEFNTEDSAVGRCVDIVVVASRLAIGSAEFS